MKSQIMQMTTGRNSSYSKGLILIILQLFVAQVFSQQTYFVDGYHGGVYGHYPKQYTKFITETLDKHPDWKINLEIEPETWDTVQANEPANYAIFKKYFNDDQSVNGRLEYVNPAYGQSYLYNTNGESIIRQFQYGIKKLKQHFPDAVFTTYSSEEPCFTSALPQLLISLGFKYASLKNPNTCWGGYTRAFGGELVNWVGPDGTAMPTVPRYAIEAFEPRSTWQTTASSNSKKYIEAAIKYGITNPVGMCLQDAGWKNGPWLGKQAATYTTWRNYFQQVAVKKPATNWHLSQEDIQVSLVWGSQVLQTIAKRVRASENNTGKAEKLSTMANVYANVSYDHKGFDEAWRGILLAQHHDCWIVPYNGRKGNTWIDKVKWWTGTADSITEATINKSMQALGANAGKGDQYIRVFNTSATARTELVKLSLPENYDEQKNSIIDANGKPVTTQLLQTDTGKLALLNADVPSMGFATYRIVEKKIPFVNHHGISLQADGTYKMETAEYRLIIDPGKGGRIKSLVAKKMNNKELVDQKNTRSFNELRGYFFRDSSYFSSTDNPATISIIADGPFYSSLQIKGSINKNPFTQTLALTAGQSLIDLQVKIDWQGNPGIGEPYKQNGGYKNEDYHKGFYNDSLKLQTLFPLNLANQQVYKDAPFDVTKSKLDNTFFQTWDSIKNNVLLNWVDVTDGAGKYGVALFSDHTTSYAHGKNFPLGLTTQYAGVGLWGRDYSVTTPTELHYAIMPHEGKWDAAGLWNMNINWNNPLTATVFRSTAEIKEYSRSLINTGNASLELTAVTMDGNDLVARFFNAGTKTAVQQMSFDGSASQVKVEELNAREKQVLKKTLTNKKTIIQTSIPKFGICTIRLVNFKANMLSN